MIQVDLITGFLGSGKTTFLRKYARYWINQGIKIAILEFRRGQCRPDVTAGFRGRLLRGGDDRRWL